MPNGLAYLAVFGFPLIAMWLFRRHAVPVALTWTVLLGYLMLPTRVSIDLPVLPAISKNSVPAVSALLMCIAALTRERLMIRRGRSDIGKSEGSLDDTGSWLPKSVLLRVLIVLFLISPMMTVLSNSAGFVVGGRFLPGLRPYDALSAGLSGLMTLIPFFLARRFLSSTQNQILLLKILCIAMVGYAALALIEIRLSPQLNRWVYGFFPHSFVQHIRGGGFRPLVFLNHGLLLGLLLAMSVLGAVGLKRTLGQQAPGFLAFAIPWLFVTLVLSKTLGAFLIALVLFPVVLLFNTRLQLKIAALLGVIVLIYPMLRGTDIIPTQQILSAAESVDSGRAQSLAVRFSNEDALLAHANRRPLLGWGGWGRSRVYDERTGRDITVTDGAWIITVGVGGWIGYVALFGLLVTPLLLLAWRGRTFDLSMVTSILCLVQAANLIDLIPNSGLTPITWLITGALWGRYELGVEKAPEAAKTENPPVPRSPYRRQFGAAKARAGSLPAPGRHASVARAPNGMVTGRRS